MADKKFTDRIFKRLWLVILFISGLVYISSPAAAFQITEGPKILAILQTGSPSPSLQPGTPGNSNGSRPVAPSTGGLQRGSGPANTDSGRDAECQRRRSDWERNIASKSIVFSFAIFSAVICGLTIIKVSRTFIRAFFAAVITIIVGPMILGLLKYDNFRVCPDPPGFFGVFGADFFIWTLAGIGLALALIFAIRKLAVIRPKFSKKQATS